MLAVAGALLLPAGPLTAPALATTPPQGLCVLALAMDEELLDEVEFGDGFLPPLFLEEGVAIVAGRPAALLIQVLEVDEVFCDSIADDVAAEFDPFGPSSAVRFFPGALPPDTALDPDDSDRSGVAVLTLSSGLSGGGTGGGDPVGWDDLGGLIGAFGADLTGDITITPGDPSEATVPLFLDGFGGFPGVFLAIDLLDDAAGEYSVDIELLLWAGGDDPDVDGPTRKLDVPLDLVVAPPLGMCLSTLLLDADAYEATLAELDATGIAIGDEANELLVELDDLEDIPFLDRTAAEDARIDEIRARLGELEDESLALDASFTAAPFTALVTELEPGMRLYLTTAALPLFASACTTSFGPDAVFVPGTVDAGGPGGLSSIEHLALRAVLERDGIEVAWDTVGGGFTYSDIVEALIDAADFTFPGRTVEPELDVTGAALTTGLVPASGPLGAGFLVEVELVAADDLVAGDYTVRGDYRDVDDPSDVRTIGTTTSTFAVPVEEVVVEDDGGSLVDELEEELEEELVEELVEVEGTLECSAPVVGVGGACVLTATPGRTFTWEASTNPVFATGQVTTDASGVGEFSFVVPESLQGREISVRVIGVAGSAGPIGVAAPPVPAGSTSDGTPPVPSVVPAGGGVLGSTGPLGMLLAVALLAAAVAGRLGGLAGLSGAAARRRRAAPARPR